MDSTKYVGMDVHTEAISVAARNSAGNVIMESILETKANTILELRRNVHVTFEEGTWAAWLYDLLKPHVTKVVVCNPRKNALLKDGNKGDKIDARKLSGPDSDLYIIYNVGTQFPSIAPANPPQVREHSKKTLGQSYWSNLINLRDCA